ncbi:hypothetical protein [Aridibaculum aurantiacum]|uniref:hypothetical protein n=1 Tax=Aridibaculum aurantiacum TaxID=2810307 RepID=UPI001A9760F8|nr:hypothetical protein [Aridibaculum aurantiacum]
MQLNQNLQQQITEEQNRYQALLLNGKEFSSLKAIKNNIKKLQKKLFELQKQ